MNRPRKTRKKLPHNLPAIKSSQNNKLHSIDSTQKQTICPQPVQINQDINLQQNKLSLQSQNCKSIQKLINGHYNYQLNNHSIPIQICSQQQVQYQINKQGKGKCRLKPNKRYKSESLKNAFLRYNQLEQNQVYQRYESSPQRKLMNILRRNAIRSVKKDSVKSQTINATYVQEANISRQCLLNFFNRQSKKQTPIKKTKLQGDNILIILRPKDKKSKLKQMMLLQQEKKKKSEQRYYSEHLGSPKHRIKYNQVTLSGWKTNNQEQFF